MKSRIRVEIDWIELRLQLAQPSNPWFIKRVIDGLTKRSQHVTPLDETAGGAATAFSFRLQDPPVLRALGRELEAIWPGCRADITGMEVAMDTYLTGASTKELARYLHEQFKWMEYPSSGNWHLYRKKGERPRELGKLLSFSGTDLVEALTDQWQLADFNKNKEPVSVRFHLHVKTTDYNQRQLPPRLHRARFEVTLHGDSLPWRTVAELATANFTDLHRWFRFRRENPHAPPHLAAALRSRLLDANLQLGTAGTYRRPPMAGGVRRRGRPNKFRSVAVADTGTNAVVYDQLRRLRGSRDPGLV